MQIRTMRLQRAWSQDELAEIVGVNVRTIQRLERGSPPSLETAKALASAFGVNVQCFMPVKTTTSQEFYMTEDNKQSLLTAKHPLDGMSQAVRFAVVGGGVLAFNLLAFLIIYGPSKKFLSIFSVLAIFMIAASAMNFVICRMKMRFTNIKRERL